MAGTNSNYSIILDAVLDLEKIQSKLNSKKYNIEVEANMTGDAANRLRDTNSATRSLEASTGDLTLTYQQFRQVLDSVIDVAGKMYEQVKTLDTAQTEFKKVSDLSGQALDDYTAKLAKMGQSVGRTGKPNRSEPVCCDGKAAQRTAPKPLKASRALSLQHEDEKSLSVIINNELVRKQKDDKDDSMVEKPKESMINNVS